MSTGASERPALVLEAFGNKPLRRMQSFSVRQRRAPDFGWYTIVILADHRGRAKRVGGDVPRPATLARAQASIDRRFCGER